MSIGTYSRNNPIYQYFDEYTPYEKIKAVTRPLLDKIRDDVNEDILYMGDRLRRAREMKDYVATMNNTLEEKMELINNIEATLNNCSEEIENAIKVKSYLNFLDDIIESVVYKEHIDYKAYLYVGIEVGSPTSEDIVR